MFSIAIRYLCGFASAAHPKSKEAAEWPPHPDRVFMALSAAYFETDQDPSQKSALEWLEACNTPKLCASGVVDYHASVPFYVPVNLDVKKQGEKRNIQKKKPMKEPTLKEIRNQSAEIPDHREKKKRYFPSVIPENDTVHLIYEDFLPDVHWIALQRLCEKVGYVGDTASLVQMWVDKNPPAASLTPVQYTQATMRLRTPYVGRLKDLEKDYERNCKAREYRPRTFHWGYYAAPQVQNDGFQSSGYDLYIFRCREGNTLDIRDTLALTDAFRGAVMNHSSQQPPPEWVSGHTADRKPSLLPHIAFLALPFVGHEHADGSLKGVALAIPKHISDLEINQLLDNLLDKEGQHSAMLTMGRSGKWEIEPYEQSFRPLFTLEPSTWINPSNRWATVTPIALDRFPKADGDAESIIAHSCQNSGLPRPRDVIVMSQSLFRGAQSAKHMPLLPIKNRKGHHALAHALVIFDEQVAGPVFLGAGRFRGYGLCRPYKESL